MPEQGPQSVNPNPGESTFTSDGASAAQNIPTFKIENYYAFTQERPKPIESNKLHPDDPRPHQDIVLKASQNLKQYLTKLSPEEKHAFIRHHFFDMRAATPLSHQVMGLKPETISRFFSLPHLALFDGDMPAILKEHIIDEKRDVEILKDIFVRFVVPNLFVGQLNLGDENVRLVDSFTITPAMAWFVDQAYAQLPSVCAFYRNFMPPSKNLDDAFDALATLGVLFGKFDKDNPHARHYREVISPYLLDSSPRLVRENIQPVSETEMDTPRLQTTKQYWHKAFVAEWMASARLDYDGVRYLNPQDRQAGSQHLSPDNRIAENRAGAQKQAQAIFAKTDGVQKGQAVIQDFDREKNKIEQEEYKARRNLQAFTKDLIKGYNPELTALVDDHGRPVGHWGYFKQKAAHIFEVFVKNAHGLSQKNVSAEQNATILSATAGALIEVLEVGKGNFQLSPTELFGPDFLRLAPVEQTSLIVFTALTLSGRQARPEKAVYLISHQLQAVLAQHHDNDQVVTPTQPVPIFNPEDIAFKMAAREARYRLRALSPKDEVLTSQNDFVWTELNSRQELESELLNLIAEGENVPECLVEANKISTTIALLILSAEMYKLFSGDVSLLSLPPLLLGLECLALTISPSYLYSNLSKKAYLNEAKTQLSEIEILAENFADKIEGLVQKKKQVESNRRKQIVLIYMAVLLAVTGLMFGNELRLSIDGFPTAQLSNDIGSLDFSRVPETIDSNQLRNLDHRYEGELLHLPSDISSERGTIVGYQPEAYVRREGGVFEDYTRQPFTAAEIITDLAELEYQPQSNELVYQVGRIDSVIHPLDGYRILKTFQVGGSSPEIGDMGELYYSEPGQQPSELVIVSEKLPPPTLVGNNSHVLHYEGPRGPEYQPWLMWPSTKVAALETNAQLSTDPPLQAIHSQMIAEADALFEQFESNEIDENQVTELWTQAASRHAVAFAEYIDTHRYYSLKFESDTDGPFARLRSVAADPNQGFYCSVGNLSFQDFMAGMGIEVLVKPGVHIRNYDTELLSRIGHMNSVILLPNGDLRFSDMTPSRPMPGEDLSALDEVPPGPDRREDIIRGFSLFAATLFAGASMYFGKDALQTRLRKRKFEEEVSESLPEDPKEAAGVLAAAEHILCYVLEASDEEKWQAFSADGTYKTKEELYQNLASDAFIMLNTTSETKVNLPKLSQKLKTLTPDQRKQAGEGLMLVRRNVVQLSNRHPEQMDNYKVLNHILKKMLAENR